MKIFSHITIYFVIWFLIILFISYFGFLTLPHSGSFGNNFIESFSNWDGGHFLGIAKFGYDKNFQYAFFPLYPLMIKLISGITQSYFWAAILISIASTYLGVQILYKLVALEYDKKLAEKAVAAMFFFPASFYFLTAYSEGLFFLLVISTFYFLKSRKLIWATIFASLASATRLAGLALVLGMLVEVITTSGIGKKNWYVFFAPFGFLIYCWYLYYQTGDPFYFISAENHWQRSLAIPAISFWETIKNLSQTGFINNHFNVFLDLIFAVFGVGLSIRAFRFLSPGYATYFLASVLLPLFTPILTSTARFLLPIFPIFILLALTKNKFLVFGYQLISIMMLSIFVTLFVSGYWVS